MINRSLDLLRMERGTYVADLNDVDLLDILDQVVDSLQGPVTAKGLQVRIRIEGRPALEAERLAMRSDGLLLFSMFSNLIKNAVEAAPPGSSIQIDCVGAQAVEISNPGEVPAAIRDHFFEKYRTAGKARGTGLGAYSAQLIARTLGGSLALDASTPGRTRLLVEFPG